MNDQRSDERADRTPMTGQPWSGKVQKGAQPPDGRIQRLDTADHCHQCRPVMGSRLNVQAVVFANKRGQRRGSARNGQRCPVQTASDAPHRAAIFVPSRAAGRLLSSSAFDVRWLVARTASLNTWPRAACTGATENDGPESVAALAPPIPRTTSAATVSARTATRWAPGLACRRMPHTIRRPRIAASL